ncbi:MAG: PAS domain S-box protein, partial [Pseudomonadota bacterium]
MSNSKTSRRLPQRLIEWLFLGMILLALGGFVAYSLIKEYHHIDLQERQRLLAQARVVDENLGRQLHAVNLSLASVISEVPYWKGKPDGAERANRQLKTMGDAMPGVRTLSIIDSNGTMIAAGREEVIGKNFSHREYFQTVLSNPNPDILFVGQPFMTVLGIFTIPLSRVISGPKGRLAGIVNATLDPEEFGILLSSVRYAEDMRVSLIHGDGKLFLTAPGLEGSHGEDLAKPGTPFSRHRDSGRTTSILTDIGSGGDAERLVALHTIRSDQLHMDKPLVVAISRDLRALYATWRQEVLIHSGLLLLLSLAISLILFFYQRWQRKFEHLKASYRTDLQEKDERLRLAAEADGVGVWEYDLASRKLSWDDSMYAIYGLDASRVSSLYQAWKSSLMTEDSTDTEAVFQDALRERRKIDTQFRIHRGDGEIRTISAIAKVHHDDAGLAVKMVGINEDITERLRTEQDLRIAAAAFETQDGMMVTDHASIILRVNRAFTRLTGYSAEEALGETPNILRSGRHDKELYRRLWETLLQEKYWEGEV